MADDSRHSSSPATPSISNPSTPRPDVRATPPLARATPPLARATPPLNMPGSQLPPHVIPSSLAVKNVSQAPMGPSPGQQGQMQGHHQSKYAALLAVIEDMGRDIRPTYSGNRTSTERLKRSIVHARILVRECLMECERSART
ncbi:cyclin-dependent kinase 2-associated protein [Plakobranchus ocellatus]|uniref:Cyclin-dependent kinase 2-associated protein n=1 Tax=Plakobranchus ocellatus TaxID=259542 RepID=A0AAV4AK31_9GAST|nr:cyclin-dependent kinase 2-associated protein [Plakobranchus ocellatus]